MRCRIQWIDKHGRPTPDENAAIGVVWRESYEYVNSVGTIVRFNETEKFPICEEHYQVFVNEQLDAQHWYFEGNE